MNCLPSGPCERRRERASCNPEVKQVRELPLGALADEALALKSRIENIKGRGDPPMHRYSRGRGRAHHVVASSYARSTHVEYVIMRP